MPQPMLAANVIPLLPSPPLITRLLFEDPLILTAILIAAAVGAFVIFNSRGKVKKAMLWCGAGLAFAAGIQVLAFAITTDREAIIAATTPVVKATAAADTARLDTMLDRQVKLTNDKGLGAAELPHGGAWDRAQIFQGIRESLGDKFRLKSCDVISVDGIVDAPGRGRTQVQVRAATEAYEIPMTSWWRLEWKQGKDGAWLVTGIEPLDLGMASRLR